MWTPQLFHKPIPRKVVERLAEESYKDRVKFVVDLERKKIAVGGKYHVEAEKLLLEDGSEKKNLWGASYYLHQSLNRRYEYSSAINVRPQDGNVAERISSEVLQSHIRDLAQQFFGA